MKERIQQIETVGVSYSSADIFRLLESGWNVKYESQRMVASRTVFRGHAQNGEQDEDNDHSN